MKVMRCHMNCFVLRTFTILSTLRFGWGGFQGLSSTYEQAHVDLDLLILASYYLTIKERGCTIEKKEYPYYDSCDKITGTKRFLEIYKEEHMTKKQLALEVIERLKKEYPLADCTLDYDAAWKLLVSVRLAAQCTDARVNVVVQDLYAKYPDVDALAEATPEEIEAIVRPCGLGKSKARDISACMKMLRDEYDGKVPCDFDAILKLPGVGRKSANLIMGDVFKKPAIVTDTHCIRLTNRIGLVDGIKDPKKVEMALWKIIPPEEGSDFCHRLVYHGREVCTARTKPYCDRCCLADICAKNGI